MTEAINHKLATPRPALGRLRLKGARRPLALLAAFLTLTALAVLLARASSDGAAAASPSAVIGTANRPAGVVSQPLPGGDHNVASCCQSRLTPDGASYLAVEQASSFVVTNDTSGNNERELLYSNQQKSEADSSYCARWVSGTGLAQNGAAFHISNHGRDAVVLERNIFNKGFWGFVVIYFHDGAIDLGPRVDFSSYLGKAEADVYPLNICATLTGNTLRFAVGKGSTPATLGAPGRSATLIINEAPTPGAASVGQTGTYVAHVPPGTSASIDHVVIDGAAAS